MRRKKLLNTPKKFGERLKNEIKKSNYTQKEISKLINVSEVTLVNYIKEKTMPDIKNLIEIANILNVKLQWLLTGDDKNNSDEEQEIIDMYNCLTYENKIIAKHEIKKLIDEQQFKSDHPKSSAYKNIG